MCNCFFILVVSIKWNLTLLKVVLYLSVLTN